MPIVRSVLCPVDFSEPSRYALSWASAIAQRRGAELTILSVLEPLLAQVAGIRLGVDFARADAELALREFVETTLPGDVKHHVHVRMETAIGAPPDTILHTSGRLSADLIVMGTHGLGGFRKLLLGSTTEHVLRRTEWPVLAVPPDAAPAPDVEHPGIQLKKILVATDSHERAMPATQWASDLASDMGIPLVLAQIAEPLSVATSGDAIAALALEHGAGLVVTALTNHEGSDSRVRGSIAYRVLRVAAVPVAVVPAVTQPEAMRSVAL